MTLFPSELELFSETGQCVSPTRESRKSSGSHCPMSMWWLAAQQEGARRGELFLEDIKGGYLNHGYLSWGFILKMPEVGAFSILEHFLLVGTPSWRKLIDVLRRKWGPSEKGQVCEIEVSEQGLSCWLVVTTLQFVGHILSYWCLDTAEPPP